MNSDWNSLNNIVIIMIKKNCPNTRFIQVIWTCVRLGRRTATVQIITNQWFLKCMYCFGFKLKTNKWLLLHLMNLFYFFYVVWYLQMTMYNFILLMIIFVIISLMMIKTRKIREIKTYAKSNMFIYFF